AAVHSHPSWLFRPRYVRTALLDWARQAPVRQRLWHLDSEVADRQIHGLRNSGRGDEGDRVGSDARDEEEDTRSQCGSTVWHRHRGAEEEDQGGGRIRASRWVRSRARVSSMCAQTAVDRKAEVWTRLQTVTDPELDEPVTDLEFVTRADVDADNCVHIEFRLPTYWCAANFSFLMADDMRNAVKKLPWVADVSVVLGEHMYADKINAGLAQGLSFQETFGAEADGDLDELRRTFLLKACQRRQAALLAHLIEAGHDAARLVEMTLDELVDLEVDDAGARSSPMQLRRLARLSMLTANRCRPKRCRPMSARCDASTSMRNSTALFVAACCTRGLTRRRRCRQRPGNVSRRHRFPRKNCNSM